MQVSTACSSHNAHPAVSAPVMPFANLRGAALAQFDAMAAETSHVRGTRLFAEDEAPKSIFILRSGRVKLSVTSQEGKTAILRIASAGNILGLSAVLAGATHEVTAEVIEPCLATVIRASDFAAFLQSHPEASMEATRCILNEYQATFSNVCRLALPATVAGRLAKLLLEWRSNHTRRGEKPERLTVALTQEEIAGMTNTSRETVSRVLHQFQREKFISMKGVSLTVLQPQALQQLAS
jgi:CRP/FNR family transcriptional regulator, cyclic AMP receptor protein